MLKGKLYYKNKHIKYKVIMVRGENDITVIIKTKLGKRSLFPLELILDSFKSSETQLDKNAKLNKFYSERIKDFLVKWNSTNKNEIKSITEDYIKNEIDKHIKDYNTGWSIDKLVGDFNNRGNYYEDGDFPLCPSKIPMPNCKEPIEKLKTKRRDNMYKVKYYTLAKLNDGTIGNCEQFRDTYYTEHSIPNIPIALQNNIDRKYDGKKTQYVVMITEILRIDGHMELS